MLALLPGLPISRLLVIGSHADDIEIGCGGTVLELVRHNPDMAVTWVVLSAGGAREREARESAAAFLEGAGRSRVAVHTFRDGYLPSERTAVKDVFEGLKDVRPDLVLTHAGADAHQDHRLASELTWNTFRDHLILEYEVPKWDGDLGRPNLYAPLEIETVERKIELLLRQFPSQREKHWFDAETFRSILRLRGVECGARYAEAFVARKLTLSAGPAPGSGPEVG